MGNTSYPVDDSDPSDTENEPDENQTGIDEYVEPPEDEDEDDNSGAVAAVGAGSAGAGAAGAGAAGAGAGGAGAAGGSGAAGGVGAGVSPEPQTEPESDDCEAEDEAEEETPESPGESEEPTDSTSEEADGDSDNSEDDESEEAEEEEEEEDEDQDETVTITLVVDPLSYASFDMQPVVKRVLERFRDQVELELVPAPVRSIDEEPTEPRNGMPLDSALDSSRLQTTEQVNRAWIAAMKQGRGDDYLRRLWIEAFAEGTNLGESKLLELAAEMSLDLNKFEEDMANAELSTGSVGELPVTKMDTKVPASLNGYVRYVKFQTLLATEGVTPQVLRPLHEFVEEHGPVTTAEVMEVYEYNSQTEAESELEATVGVERSEIGVGTFWNSA